MMRVCAAVSCPALIEPGQRYCDACRPKRRYAKRPSPRTRGYSTRWDAFSKAYRARNPVCVHCGAPSEHVDHLDGAGPLGPRGWDESNLAATCRSCHSKATVRFDGGFGRPKAPRPGTPHA